MWSEKPCVLSCILVSPIRWIWPENKFSLGFYWWRHGRAAPPPTAKKNQLNFPKFKSRAINFVGLHLKASASAARGGRMVVTSDSQKRRSPNSISPAFFFSFFDSSIFPSISRDRGSVELRSLAVECRSMSLPLPLPIHQSSSPHSPFTHRTYSNPSPPPIGWSCKRTKTASHRALACGIYIFPDMTVLMDLFLLFDGFNGSVSNICFSVKGKVAKRSLRERFILSI